MTSNNADDIPEGWEMYTSPGSDVVLYLNMQAKKGSWVVPKMPGGWVLAARNPIRPHQSHSTDTSYVAASSSTTTHSDSALHAPLHRSAVSRGHHHGLPTEISCSHILIKHNESRRPTSWRCDTIRRTKEEALVIVKDFREQIVNKENKFEDIARIFSDCSSAKRHGDLGRFKRGQMQKAFEMVAFKLKVGEMSKPVETKSGIHLILRTQ